MKISSLLPSSKNVYRKIDIYENGDIVYYYNYHKQLFQVK